MDPLLKTLITAASILLAATLHLQAAEPVSGQVAIGFRGDGWSGVMPPDCKPPKDFNGVSGKNLRWKTPLPNHGNSAPIAVNGKVFVTCDGGWPEGQDCPQLLCYDANNGKELWRRDLDHFDNLPEAEAKAAKADRAEYWKQFRENQTLWWELRYNNPDAARQTAIIEHFKKAGFEVREPALEWFRDKINSLLGMRCEKELEKRLAKVGFGSPQYGWLCLGVVMSPPASDGRAVYVATGHRTMSAFDLDGKKLWQMVIPQNIPGEGAIWSEQFAHAPFLVEGKLLMHWYNHLWCYEPTSGKLLWSTKTKPIPAHSMGQPTVLRLDAGGKPVTCIFTTWGQLIRLSDGKLLMDKIAWFGSNAIMSGDGKDVVWGKNGAEADKPREERPFAERKDFFGIRFRLDASGETATAEAFALPCSDLEMGWSNYPTYDQGRIYCMNGGIIAWDGRQGKLLRIGPRHFVQGGPYGNFLADGRIYYQTESKGQSAKGAINGTRTSFVRWFWVKDGRPLRIYDNWDDTSVNHYPKRFFDCPVEIVPAPMDMSADQQRKVITQIGRADQGPFGGIYTWFNDYKMLFAAGECLYVRTFDNLYCFAPEVNGTLNDDPAKLAGIRQETKTEALLPALGSTSAQQRFEAARRLAALKAPLPAPVADILAKMLIEDPHDEIRLAAMQALDACDPAGKAGYTVLATKEFPLSTLEKNHPRRLALARMFDDLDGKGLATFFKRWPEAEADPVQRAGMLDLALALNWKDPAILQSALAAAQEPKRWTDGNSRMLGTGYLAQMDAAADPAMAAILLKVFATDFSMEAAFRKNLPTEQYLAWLEGYVLATTDVRWKRGALPGWSKIGPAAKPSMQRIAAAMGSDPKLDENSKKAQLEFRKEIETAIAAMEKK